MVYRWRMMVTVTASRFRTMPRVRALLKHNFLVISQQQRLWKRAVGGKPVVLTTPPLTTSSLPTASTERTMLTYREAGVTEPALTNQPPPSLPWGGGVVVWGDRQVAITNSCPIDNILYTLQLQNRLSKAACKALYLRPF